MGMCGAQRRRRWKKNVWHFLAPKGGEVNNKRCFSPAVADPVNLDKTWASNWKNDTTRPTKSECSESCQYWCGAQSTDYNWCPTVQPKPYPTSKKYTYRFLCLGGETVGWGGLAANSAGGPPSYGLYLQGAGRCKYYNALASQSDTARLPNESLIMLIGQANGLGIRYNLNECPGAFLQPIIDAGYNGILLDIERSIYPPVLYELLTIIKKYGFKTGIYTDGCGAINPGELQIWSQFKQIFVKNNKKVTDLVDYFFPSNYGGMTGLAGGKGIGAAPLGNCSYTDVCDYKWLTGMDIPPSKIIPGTNCGAYMNESSYYTIAPPSNAITGIPTSDDYTNEYGGWAEWFYYTAKGLPYPPSAKIANPKYSPEYPPSKGGIDHCAVAWKYNAANIKDHGASCEGLCKTLPAPNT